MKTIKNSIIIFFTCLGIMSCNKVEVETPVFDVKVDSLTYKVGDEVEFKFTGDADQITFYSGESLNDYTYKDGRIEEVLSINASFSTAIRYGLGNGQKDMLSVWISSDFNGNYTIEDIQNATWKNNVSKNFVLAPSTMDNSDAANYVPSGVLDITSEAEEGKPMYFAFKYRKDDPTKTQRNWFMRNIVVNAVTNLGNYSLFDGSAFKEVYDNNFVTDTERNSSVTSGGVITLRSPSTFDTRPLVEVWAISPPISTEDTNLGPDKGTPIKGFRDLKKDNHSYTYIKEGVYTATFVASNSNLYGESKVVKQITITVTQ